ncbi:MAG: hypothetical protein IKV79_05400 [Oscillospiraceae bacterium]|nr:hypothetical protein [Oscillospiraceae bacterium]
MKKVIDILKATEGISDWKINLHRRESCELFYIKGKLDCVRRTDTTNNLVTVYVDSDGCRGDAQFYVYPSTTQADIRRSCAEATKRATLIKNAPYTLPEGEEGEYSVESNFVSYDALALAKDIAAEALKANTVENAAINSLEVFVTRHCESIINSRGINKTQRRYDAMVEAIPTYNGEKESVELYEQYNFSNWDAEALRKEISEKMQEVKSRYEAAPPAEKLGCPVILRSEQLSQLFREMAWDIDYSSVYSRSALHQKGDAIQKAGSGDKISITMLGSIPGSVRSACFDADGLSLGSAEIIKDGIVCAYHGSNRFGQYIGEKPSGALPCIKVEKGSLAPEAFSSAPALEIVSMSGLQVDFYSDYIGGEVRLAYYFDGEKTIPLTGLSIAGKLSEVLAEIALSEKCALSGAYFGPEKALISNMNIF